jgi:hypothetical protein
VVDTITAGAAPITTAYSNNSYIPAAMPATIAAPQVTYAAPQATVVESFTAGATAATYPASYIPAQPAMVETVAPQVTYAGAAPQMTYAGAYAGAAPQMTYAGASPATTVVETFAPGIAPTVVAAPASYLPPPVVETAAAPAVTYAYAPNQATVPVLEAVPSGQSVIIDQLGDWQVCEDAAGIFYHHVPSQQSHDEAPAEFLALFPQGYMQPQVGAFAAATGGQPIAYAAPAVVETFGAAPQVAYAAAPQVVEMQAAPQFTYMTAPQA